MVPTRLAPLNMVTAIIVVEPRLSGRRSMRGSGIKRVRLPVTREEETRETGVMGISSRRGISAASEMAITSCFGVQYSVLGQYLYSGIQALLPPVLF